MVCTLPGTRFLNTTWSSRAAANDSAFSLSFPRRLLQLSRKNLSGTHSYGTKIPSVTLAAAHKELTVHNEEHLSISRVPHDCEICTPRQRFNNEPNNERDLRILKSLPPLSTHLKFLFPTICGVFGLQYAEQALAVMNTDVASSNLESFSLFGDLGSISTGFASAFLLIFFSELGDKTFFIAALLAARNSAAVTFIGTFGALAVMTVISVVLGRTFHYVDDILPFRLGNTDLPVDDLAAVGLLVYFGVSTLIDASSENGLKQDEEQKEAEVAVSELSGSGAGILAAANTVFSTFVLVFVAEWGDKSFFSTIALAAASSPLGVIAGALAGHGVATLLAVLGGSFLGTYLSEKAIAYIGGTLFLVFAAITLVEIVMK